MSCVHFYFTSHVFIPGNPDPPIIQDTTVLSAYSVHLKWNTTTGQLIANFSVEMSVDSVSWEEATCNQSLVQGACVVTQSEAAVMVLKPYTNYTFRVVARNPFGRSNYSTASEWVVTDEAGTCHYIQYRSELSEPKSRV